MEREPDATRNMQAQAVLGDHQSDRTAREALVRSRWD